MSIQTSADRSGRESGVSTQDTSVADPERIMYEESRQQEIRQSQNDLLALPPRSRSPVLYSMNALETDLKEMNASKGTICTTSFTETLYLTCTVDFRDKKLQNSALPHRGRNDQLDCSGK